MSEAPDSDDVLADLAGLGQDALPPVTPETLESLTKLAEDYETARDKMEAAEIALKNAKDRFDDIATRTLPEMMEKARAKSYETDTGLKIVVDEKLRASCKKDDKDEMYDWFDANGRSSLIKRVITIDFDKSEDKWAKKFAADCAKRKKPLRLNTSRSIHHATLDKEVSNILEEGELVLPKVVSTFRQKTAKVTRKKTPGQK